VRGKRIHDKLVEAAGELFQDFGYASVSIRNIVAKAGVPKGTFYSYFTSKEALASLVAEQQLQAVLTTLPVESSVEFIGSLKEHFVAINRPTQGQAVSPMRLLATFAAEAPALPSVTKKQVAAGFATWSSQLGNLIFKAQMDGQIREGQDPHALADFLINACQGAIIRAKCDRTTESLRAFAQFAPENLLAKRDG
jgi:TetR/AcrR family transcriptional repressor of nem operon